MNDAVALYKAKVKDFGQQPYFLSQIPLDIKIIKSTQAVKKSGMSSIMKIATSSQGSSDFDLLIDGQFFSLVRWPSGVHRYQKPSCGDTGDISHAPAEANEKCKR